jgi:hypothetical protein
MPGRDLYHTIVRRALIKEGWTITHDPLYLPFGRRKVFIDLAADAPIGAEKDGQKIAVEIKSFIGESEMADLEQALGQLVIYQYVLQQEEPERMLYLALSQQSYSEIFDDRASLNLMVKMHFQMLIFDVAEEKILEWIE